MNFKFCRTQLPLYQFFLALLFVTSCYNHANSQSVDELPQLVFDFNNHTYQEKYQRVTAKPVSVSLVDDRFGNESSALYLHGHAHSYLNLGTSPLLKPRHGSVSLWVKLERKVFAGRGYESNPIIVTKNSPNPDFYDAYNIFYDFKTDRFLTYCTKDSTEQVGGNSIETVVFNKWYHLLVTYNDREIAFYVDGKLQTSSPKEFETVFLKTDSVVVGNGASKKNDRYMRGSVDDIRIFHVVLTPKQVLELYNEPNPNRLRDILLEVTRYLAVLLIIAGVIIVLTIRNKKNLKRQQEYYELKSRINELEIKVVKTQMNPHFVSNCLAAIQDLIYQKEIEKAAQYIAKFSMFLRQVLYYSDQAHIELKEEMELIRLDIELESLRFKEQFDVLFELDQSIDQSQVLIPSLITQPFIENAIWHGLLPLKERIPMLKIGLQKEEGCLLLIIQDNGVGRDPEKMRLNLRSKGTKLIIDKLESYNKLMNTDEYRIDIVDLKDKSGNAIGTKVLIRLPIITE